MTKSKCSFKRKRKINIDEYFWDDGEKRVSIENFITIRKIKRHKDTLNILNAVALRHGISKSCALEMIISTSLLYDIEPCFSTFKEGVKMRFPKLVLHPAYIDILKIHKNRYGIGLSKTIEAFILGYKKRFNITF